MEEAEVFSVYFPQEDGPKVREWLKGHAFESSCAFGELQQVGRLEFEKPIFLVQFHSRIDEQAMRRHFYPSTCDE